MSRLMAFAVGSVALAGVLKAIDLVPPEWSRDDLLTWGFAVAVNVVAAALLFGVVATRYGDRPATPALVVAVLGFLSVRSTGSRSRPLSSGARRSSDSRRAATAAARRR
ncbi:MAG TPA: hypothetical protein VG079_05465 [Gaiellaceae bacterium]|nr:hypothetical protein [Gaiellaceae bacterium]